MIIVLVEFRHEFRGWIWFCNFFIIFFFGKKPICRVFDSQFFQFRLQFQFSLRSIFNFRTISQYIYFFFVKFSKILKHVWPDWFVVYIKCLVLFWYFLVILFFYLVYLQVVNFFLLLSLVSLFFFFSQTQSQHRCLCWVRLGLDLIFKKIFLRGGGFWGLD